MKKLSLARAPAYVTFEKQIPGYTDDQKTDYAYVCPMMLLASV